MPQPRRNGVDDTLTRTALLDAAEQLMLEEGYAAVTSRRVAGKAGVNAALVYYYFGTMDDLFLAVFRRRTEQTLEHQAQALVSDQPLWALWESARDQTRTELAVEFLALGNHRKAVRAEISAFFSTFRRMQLAALSEILSRYEVDQQAWPKEAVLLLLVGMSRFFSMEEAAGIEIGHAETIETIEREIRKLEGERRARPPRLGPQKTR
jgi:AcrR family transcriptional regulator